MPCILLPAGSNPTPTTQLTKCARSRKGAGVFVVRAHPPPSKQMRWAREPRQFARVFARGVGRRRRLRLLFVNLLFVAVASKLRAMSALIVVLALIALFTLGDQ